MGEGGWRCGVGCRPLVSVAGYCLPSSGHLHIVGVLGASVVQLITSRVVRPDRPDPTETEPVALVRSLRPSCWRSDVIGSYLVAHVEELPRHLGRGVWRVEQSPFVKLSKCETGTRNSLWRWTHRMEQLDARVMVITRSPNAANNRVRSGRVSPSMNPR